MTNHQLQMVWFCDRFMLYVLYSPSHFKSSHVESLIVNAFHGLLRGCLAWLSTITSYLQSAGRFPPGGGFPYFAPISGNNSRF